MMKEVLARPPRERSFARNPITGETTGEIDPFTGKAMPTFSSPRSKQAEQEEFNKLQPLRAMGAFNDILGAAGGFTGNIGSNRNPAHYPQASQSSTRVTPVAPASKGARANPVPSEMKQGLEASRTPAFKAKQAEEAQRVADRDATIRRNRAMVENEKELRSRPREWRETNAAYKAKQAEANDKTEIVSRPPLGKAGGTEPLGKKPATGADWAEAAYKINKSLGRPTGEEDFTKGRSGSVRDTEYAPGKTQMLDQGVRDGSTTGVRGPLKQPHPDQAQVRKQREAAQHERGADRAKKTLSENPIFEARAKIRVADYAAEQAARGKKYKEGAEKIMNPVAKSPWKLQDKAQTYLRERNKAIKDRQGVELEAVREAAKQATQAEADRVKKPKPSSYIPPLPGEFDQKPYHEFDEKVRDYVEQRNFEDALKRRNIARLIKENPQEVNYHPPRDEPIVVPEPPKKLSPARQAYADYKSRQKKK